MKITKILLLLITIVVSAACSVTQNQNKGYVSPSDFYYKTNFTTKKSVMVLPLEINGIKKNFLFDTGADYNLIQRDSLLGKTGSFDGATNREMKMGKENTKSIKLGSINFVDTYGLNTNLIGLKEQISNFGGLIGQSIISKANWLINYPEKTVEISNKNLSDTSFQSIRIIREDGTPYSYISINGKEHKVIIDFGSSSDFNLPQESKLAKELLKKYNFKDRKRERYTIGGLQTIIEKVGIVSSIKLGEMEFKNIETTINVSSQPRIGIGFFKDCNIYIDNINKEYKIKRLP